MRKPLLALILAALPALAAPAVAQSYQEQQRWQSAQARYQSETSIYQRERERYMAAQSRGRGGYNDRYNNRRRYNDGYSSQSSDGYSPQSSDPYATDYDASRYYRDDPRYEERRLSSEDMVYRGSDGRYYCKRSDGTTGLIIGAAGGGILGNVIDGGHNRVAGTLIGGALGALAGRAIQQSSDVRCR